MHSHIFRFLLTLLLASYMTFIWLQSSYFNPSKLEYLSKEIGYISYTMIGIVLELAHLIEFGILYFLLIVVFLSFGKLTLKKELTALVLSLLYAVMDEIHQFYVPYRSFSMIDIVKNILGVWFVWYIVRRNYYSNRRLRIGRLLRGITLITKSKKSDTE